jgi:hypothetical protein
MINIIGNGPSLNSINKKELFEQQNISVSYNRAYIIYEEYDFYPTFYFCIDKTVLLNCLADIKKLLDTSIKYFVLLECEETLDMQNHCKVKLVKKEEDVVKYFGDVATFSVYYLYKSGFEKFNIYGCDCSYVEDVDILNVDVELNDDPARKIVLKPKKNTKDINHFIESYFSEGTEYSVPRTQNHLNCWKNISELSNIKVSFLTHSDAKIFFD